jgi:circadian clock protein KaiC
MSRSEKVSLSTKTSTGIEGFDGITHGGLPRQRITALLGGAGSGKTIFGLQTLVAGARNGEPGIFVAFEESAEQIVANASRFNWTLSSLNGHGVEFLDAQLPQAVLHGGAFDLLGLLAIVGARAKKLRAKRVVFDGIDVLLSNLADAALVRREIFRLREWLQQSGMTGIVTAKADSRETGTARDYDFLQFMADCVVSLHHVVDSGIALRMLRVEKYRGNEHSANEFPFTITTSGIEVAGGTSAELTYAVSTERITSGVERLDAMLGGGYYRGSSVLISGVPGTAKTSLATSFAEAACRRKEATVYVSFDEAPEQIVRNVASIGIDFVTHLKTGTLRMCSLRTRSASPESQVARIRARSSKNSVRATWSSIRSPRCRKAPTRTSRTRLRFSYSTWRRGRALPS